MKTYLHVRKLGIATARMYGMGFQFTELFYPWSEHGHYTADK